MPDVQAEGGAPLDRTAGGSTRPRPGRLPLVFGVAAVVLALDAASKWAAVRELSDQAPIQLLGGVLTLRLVRNPGAAFGLAQGMTVVLSALAVVVVVVILRVAGRLHNAWWAVAFGLVLGGATGNLADRLFRAPGPGRGHVVDFLELPRWPVFNVADSAIVVAGVLIVVLSLRGVPSSTPVRAPEQPESLR